MEYVFYDLEHYKSIPIFALEISYKQFKNFGL